MEINSEITNYEDYEGHLNQHQIPQLQVINTPGGNQTQCSNKHNLQTITVVITCYELGFILGLLAG